MTKLIFIAFGGALTTPFRYLINDLTKNASFFVLPSRAILVNFFGCFYKYCHGSNLKLEV